MKSNQFPSYTDSREWKYNNRPRAWAERNNTKMDWGKYFGWAAYITVLSSASKSNHQEETTEELKSEIKALRREIKELKGEPVEDCCDEEIRNETDVDPFDTDAEESAYTPIIAPGFAIRLCCTFWFLAITATVFRFAGKWMNDFMWSGTTSNINTLATAILTAFENIMGLFMKIFWPLAWGSLLIAFICWVIMKCSEEDEQ